MHHTIFQKCHKKFKFALIYKLIFVCKKLLVAKVYINFICNSNIYTGRFGTVPKSTKKPFFENNRLSCQYLNSIFQFEYFFFTFHPFLKFNVLIIFKKKYIFSVLKVKIFKNSSNFPTINIDMSFLALLLYPKNL